MGSGLFKSIAPTFEKSDFGFVNLESPLTTGGDAQGWKDVVIKGNPDLAPAMAESGINVVTMANNHAGDMGDSGLLDSIKYCEKNDIGVVGAGKDLDEAMKGTVLETEDGVKVAFLGFTDVLPVGYPATSSSPGVAPGRADIGAVKKAIKAAAKKADFVIVGWHWNFEYKRAPSYLEESEGKAAIDAGADIVFAHHPHLLNGVEAYHGGLIFYSLGNLVFSGFSGETAETVLVRAKVSEERHRRAARSRWSAAARASPPWSRDRRPTASCSGSRGSPRRSTPTSRSPTARGTCTSSAEALPAAADTGGS